MSMTLSEKILARAAGKKQVEPGEFIKAKVDVALMPDLTAILAFKAMQEMGRSQVWDNEKVVMVMDHVAPASSINAAEVHKELRKIVKEQGIKNFYDVEEGVCHQVLAEKGHVKPGMLVVGADSHTCTHGAFDAFATGIGSTDMGSVLATGKLWLKVPETIRIVVDGTLPQCVYPKDVILKVIGEIGVDGATYNAIEFSGETVDHMSLSGRMTLCNMAVEMGGKTGMVEADAKTISYLESRKEKVHATWKSDPEAHCKKIHTFDVNDLEPQIACPNNVDNVKPVSEVEGTCIDQVFIGSCTNGRIEDLEAAASFLRDRHVHSDVRLLVVPASRDVLIDAVGRGLIKVFVDAGCLVCNPSCGACFGGHLGILGSGEVGLATSNRNFKGRQGSPEAEVYLASPATAAVSAVAGVISDPRCSR